jgi:4-amino-4-deoxy-L-arabinose transferase-like glycosyltransferase
MRFDKELKKIIKFFKETIMLFKFQSELVQETQFFSQKPILRLFVIGFLFISAFGIRLYNINKPPLDFEIMRQYHSFHIARGYYFETLKSIPEWKRQVARINMERQEYLEPRIMESMTSFAYRISGGERIWIPRLLSSMFWMIGGVFLYLTAKKITSTHAALFSAAFYLFLPFGIQASRSFQPDPMMIMVLLCSVFMILSYHEKPSICRLLFASAVSALALFIKPVCIFIIFGVFVSLAVYRQGILKSVFNKNFLIFAVVSILPAIIYYIFGIISNEGYLREQSNLSFFPQLLLSINFWKDWITMIVRRIGFIPFVGARRGFLMSGQGLQKALLVGLWAGYFVFGLVFNFHIHTHDYYQLQFIPVVALSIGPICAMLLNRITYHRRLLAILAIIILAGVLTIGLNIQRGQFEDFYAEYKSQLKIIGALFGVNPQFKKFLAHDFEREVRIAQEIGEIVGHSDKVLFLDSNYGESLTYHGELSGYGWPISTDTKKRRLRGFLREPSLEESCEFKNGYTVSCKLYNIPQLHYIPNLEKYSPEYFIVTNLQDFEKQIDLKNFFFMNFPILAKNNDYLIFDLRKRSVLDKQYREQ